MAHGETHGFLKTPETAIRICNNGMTALVISLLGEMILCKGIKYAFIVVKIHWHLQVVN
jgi:hypothetical protein